MNQALRAAARRAIGFMPEPDGLLLYEAGVQAGVLGPLLEIGGYCGQSAIYLGAAARQAGTVLFSVDHHRGSEEHQPGQEYHDHRLFDAATGQMDSLATFRRTIAAAGLEDAVVAIVGRSRLVADHWRTPLGLVLIDGGHSEEAAQADYQGWTKRVLPGGFLAIHDVFEAPAEGGEAPFHVYRRALASGEFREERAHASLRLLRRVL